MNGVIAKRATQKAGKVNRMAIIKKSLGNNPDVILAKFRENYDDGIGGLRYTLFVEGWVAGWEESKKYINDKLEAENKRLKLIIDYATEMYPNQMGTVEDTVQTIKETLKDVSNGKEPN